MAALTWREGTCAQAALCEETGAVAVVDPREDDEAAARRLADAIAQAEALDHRQVQTLGMQRFDPARHFLAMAARSC
jgi:hypothetical protein